MSERDSFFSSMTVAAKLSLVVGIVLIVVAAFGLYFLVNKVPYEQILADASEADIARAVQELHSRNIPFRISEDGLNLLVEQSFSSSARMALADLGLPFDSTVGLEMFETSDFGVTEFAQRINYKRALEGELTRTISAMHEVRYARVHLVLPEKALLKSNSINPSAAITLFLRKNIILTTAQIDGVQSLAVSSVPGLQKESVTILNQSGQQLTSNVMENDVSQSKISSNLEQNLQFKVENLLSQRFFADQFRVTVSVNVEQKDIHRVENRPVAAKDGVGSVTRRLSSESYSSTNGSEPKPVTKLEEVFEYGYIREEVTIPGGAVTRLSIAVWITDNISIEEQQNIEEILRASVGADTSRGDRVVVMVSAKKNPVEMDDFGVIKKDNKVESLSSDVKQSTVVGEIISEEYLSSLPLWLQGALLFLIGTMLLLIVTVIVLIQKVKVRRLTRLQREILLNNIQSIVQSK